MSLNTFSNFDKHRGVRIPTRLNKKLAYLCGVLCGDGHLRYARRLRKEGYYSTTYSISIRMNDLSVLEKCRNIYKDCFNLDVKIKQYNSGSGRFAKSKYIPGIVFSSKAIFYYLTEKLEMKSGKKFTRIAIPQWVKKFKSRCASFVKGFYDADGYKSTHTQRNYRKNKKNQLIKYEYVYPLIGFSSKSKQILLDIVDFLKVNEITSDVYGQKTGIYKMRSVGNKNYSRWCALMRLSV